MYIFVKKYILHSVCIRSTYTSPSMLLHFPQTSGKPKSRWELRYFSACWTHGVAKKTNAIHLSLAKAEVRPRKMGLYTYDTVDGSKIRLTSWGKGSLSHDLQGFSTIPGRWLFGISSINSMCWYLKPIGHRLFSMWAITSMCFQEFYLWKKHHSNFKSGTTWSK